MTRVPAAMALIYQFRDMRHDLVGRLAHGFAPRQAWIEGDREGPADSQGDARADARETHATPQKVVRTGHPDRQYGHARARREHGHARLRLGNPPIWAARAL